jgi:hypothetical protein
MIKEDVCEEGKALDLAHVLRTGELSSDDLLRHPITQSFIYLWTASHACNYSRMHYG